MQRDVCNFSIFQSCFYFPFLVAELLYSTTVVEKSLGVVFIVMKLKVKSLLFKHSGESLDHEPALCICVVCFTNLNCLGKHHFDTDFNLTRQTLDIWLRASSFRANCVSFSPLQLF